MTKQSEIPGEKTIEKYLNPNNNLNPEDHLITDLLNGLFSTDSTKNDEDFNPNENYYLIYGLNREKRLVLYAIDERDMSDSIGDVSRIEIIDTRKQHHKYSFYLLENDKMPDISKIKPKNIKINKSNIHLLKSDKKIDELEKMYKTSIENGNYIHEKKGPTHIDLVVPICGIEAQDTNYDMKSVRPTFYGIPISKNANSKVEFNFILKQYASE